VARSEASHGLTNPGMGPVNSASQLAKIQGMVTAAVERGVRLHAGGIRSQSAELGKGWFYAPTIIEPVSSEDAIVQDEVFGPVLTVQTFKKEAEALANGTSYGLLAGIYAGEEAGLIALHTISTQDRSSSTNISPVASKCLLVAIADRALAGKRGWTASGTITAPRPSLPELRDSQSKSPIIARPSIDVDDTRHASKVKQVLQASPTMWTAWVPFADATLNAR
jgi:hypothetical protein